MTSASAAASWVRRSGESRASTRALGLSLIRRSLRWPARRGSGRPRWPGRSASRRRPVGGPCRGCPGRLERDRPPGGGVVVEPEADLVDLGLDVGRVEGRGPPWRPGGRGALRRLGPRPGPGRGFSRRPRARGRRGRPGTGSVVVVIPGLVGEDADGGPGLRAERLAGQLVGSPGSPDRPWRSWAGLVRAAR